MLNIYKAHVSFKGTDGFRSLLGCFFMLVSSLRAEKLTIDKIRISENCGVLTGPLSLVLYNPCGVSEMVGL